MNENIFVWLFHTTEKKDIICLKTFAANILDVHLFKTITFVNEKVENF